MKGQTARFLRHQIQLYRQVENSPIYYVDKNPAQFVSTMGIISHPRRIKSIMKSTGLTVNQAISQYGTKLLRMIEKIRDPQAEIERQKIVKKEHSKRDKYVRQYTISPISSMSVDNQIARQKRLQKQL